MTLTGRTIQSLAADLAAGKTTSRALTEAALEAIARDGSAFTLVAAERARVEADASDRLRAAGVVASPLAGVPISVKDLFDVAGEVTTAGTDVLRGSAPASRDAPVVARLRAAGAVIVGRTHMSEFAFTGLGVNPHYPRCANPHDGARVPGGSSSGAGVSVARGQAAMGLGTDTGGSVRIPSAFCGVVGFKPTQQRVSRDGGFPLAPTLDSIGPLANSVACCAFVDALIADEAIATHPALGIAGLRFGVPTDFVLGDVDEVVGRAFERTLSRLSAAGARVERVAIPALRRMPEITARGTIANAEAFALHTRLGLLSKRERYDQIVLSRIDIGGKMTAKDYLDLLDARAVMIAEVAPVSARYDALLLPTCPTVPPRFDDVADAASFGRLNGLVLRNSSVFNFLDRCALSLPMHAAGELPSGLMVVGERMGDARLLAVGAAIEAALA
jgi:aspartyl-tRNA(Asn)/glutamyl-tRNA(Gln) amidotransferase subunit A